MKHLLKMKCTEYQFETLNMNEGQNLSIPSIYCIQMWAANAPVCTHMYRCIFNPAVLTSVCLITTARSPKPLFKHGAQFMGKLYLAMDFH